MRLFVGVPLEGEPHAAVCGLLLELKQRLPACRWINPDNLHLTLRFLGEVPDTRMEEVREWFQRLVEATTFTPIKLAKTGSFKHRNRILFWCGVRTGGWLKDLADRLSGPVANVPAEPRPFVPHLTLGRCHLNPEIVSELPAFQEYFSQLQIPPEQQIAVRVVLYESQLTPEGPVYREQMAFGSPLE